MLELGERACVFSEQGGVCQLALFSVGRLVWNPTGEMDRDPTGLVTGEMSRHMFSSCNCSQVSSLLGRDACNETFI